MLEQRHIAVSAVALALSTLEPAAAAAGSVDAKPVLPFSAPRSYLAVAPHKENDWWCEHPGGLFLRTLRTDADTPFVALFVPLASDGTALAFESFERNPEVFRAKCPAGSFEFVFPDERTLLVRADRENLGLRIDFLAEGRISHLVSSVPAPAAAGGKALLVNSYKNRTRYLLAPRSGSLAAEDSGWDGRSSKSIVCTLRPADGESAGFSIREFAGDWDGSVADAGFDESVDRRRGEFDAFLSKFPASSASAARDAAYLLWSTSVAKEGSLRRDALLMSKNWMNRLWSWDHCFNAIALADVDGDLAWDSFMAPFDLQLEDGMLPDFVSGGRVLYGYVKPPIHGWTLRRLMRKMEISGDRLSEAYGCISRWTRWWLSRRDRDGDGLCEYDHGNDSGWDNSTAFLRHPPVETPDLAAFLAIQCDVLADVARLLGRPEGESRGWKRTADAQIAAMEKELFGKDARPLVRAAYTHETFSPDTLLLRLPVLLGDRLPSRLREPLVADLSSGRFLTEWGYATESPASESYIPDGYWRGPVWAPSTMLVVDGLEACGRRDLALTAARRFVAMCDKNGFAENFDALTGKGLRDRAYTWTASVYLILAAEYGESRRETRRR